MFIADFKMKIKVISLMIITVQLNSETADPSSMACKSRTKLIQKA
jgi:hypothetical protein